VKVQHYMKVKLITSAFAENLSIKIPIHIGNAMMHDPLPEQRYESPLPTPYSTFPDTPIIVALPIADPTAQPVSTEASSDYAHATMLGDTAVHSEEEHDPDCDVTDILDTPDRFERAHASCCSSHTLFHHSNRLLQSMTTTGNGYSEISQRLAQEEWNHVFQNLQPGDFGMIIASVRNDFDQPRVAAIASRSHREVYMRPLCLALRNTSNWNRTTMIVKLVTLYRFGIAEGYHHGRTQPMGTSSDR
jgi:hypothetical protein